MKKFLIFLVAIVVVVCFGVTTFYFLRNDETITLSKSSLQINEGDHFSLRAKDYTGLGLTVTKQNRKTKYGYKVYQVVDGEKVDVTDKDYIHYEAKIDTYSAQKGGQYIFTITTTNKKYKELNVNLSVGDGNTTPYFIRTAEEFTKRLGGNDETINVDAVLLNDITLPSTFVTLPTYEGNFDGNGKTISGLNITGEGKDAGLFTKITGNVTDLTLNKPVINGEFDFAGALAGEISDNAVVSGVQIKQANITNTDANGVTGGLAGSISGEATIAVSYTDKANINVADATEAVAIAANQKTVGGLVGVNDKADIKASYAKDVTISGNETANAGGLVGEFIVAKSYESDNADDEFKNNGTIQQSYATGATGADMGAFIGKVTDKADDITVENSEPYSYLVGNYAEKNGDQELIKEKDSAKKLFEALAGKVSVPNYVNALPENNEYMFYGTTPWQANLWEFTNETPSLKLENGITINNVNNPDSNYIYSAREPVEVNEQNSLDDALKDNSKRGHNLKLKYIEDGYTLNDKYDFTNKTLVGEPDEKGNLPVIKTSKGLFKTITNSSISNVVIEITGIETDNDTFGALANIATSDGSIGSKFENITVKFNGELTIDSAVRKFGGLIGSATNCTISNCSVEGLNIKSSAIENFGGLVADSKNTTININNNKVNATVNTTAAANIGGVVASSDKEILGADDINLEVKLNVASVGGDSNISAIAANNNGTISNIKLNAEVDFNADLQASLFVAGAAVNNNGKIENVYFETGRLGNTNNGEVENHFVVGHFSAGHVVAGLVVNANANSIIRQATVKADLNGYNVSGIVYRMADTSANIDQVYVGGNTLYATGYVANIGYSVNYGTINNVQLESTLKGKSTNTHVSAMVYYFGEDGTVEYVTVNSVFDGNGIFHRETRYMNTGSKNTTVDSDNILGAAGSSGRMTNVVINTQKLTSGSVKSYYHCYYIGNGAAGFFAPQITTPWVNFVRPLNDDNFKNSAFYSGNFKLSLNSSNTLSKPTWSKETETYNLSFLIGTTEDTTNTWRAVENAGIQLTFLKNILANA